MEPKFLFQLQDQAKEAKAAGNLDLAYEKMSEYLQNVDPSFTHGNHLFLAEIDFQLERFENAIKHCDEAINIMSDFIPALEFRSKLYQSIGDIQSSNQDKRKIKKIEDEEKAKWDDPNHYYHYK